MVANKLKIVISKSQIKSFKKHALANLVLYLAHTLVGLQ